MLLEDGGWVGFELAHQTATDTANGIHAQRFPGRFAGDLTGAGVEAAVVLRALDLAVDDRAPGVSGRVLNVAAGGKISLLELIAALNKLLKTNVSPRHEPARIGDVRESMADITLARKLLNYEPRVSFEEGLRRSIDYYVGLVKK